MSPEKIKEIYHDMYLIRATENKISDEYFNDEMKTPVHLSIGQEAIPVGVLNVLPKDVQCFGTYRSHALYLSKTHDLDGFFGEMFGKATGTSKGKAGSMHLMNPDKGILATSAVVATTIPVAVGAALANQYKESSKYVVVFFGDGAVEEGAFWESLNFASLHNLNIFFVCEDNELAIHALPETRRGYTSLGRAVESFGIPYQEGNGTDVFDVIVKTKRALSGMQAKSGPQFLKFDYFRFLEHVGPLEDYKFGYRAAPAGQTSRKDPIKLIENVATESGVELASIRAEIEGQVQAAMEKAQKDPFPGTEELYTDVLA